MRKIDRELEEGKVDVLKRVGREVVGEDAACEGAWGVAVEVVGVCEVLLCGRERVSGRCC